MAAHAGRCFSFHSTVTCGFGCWALGFRHRPTDQLRPAGNGDRYLDSDGSWKPASDCAGAIGNAGGHAHSDGRAVRDGGGLGDILLGGIFETALGLSGALRRIRNWIPPGVAGLVVAAIGLSLGQLAIRLSMGDGRSLNLVLATLAVVVVLLLQWLGSGVPSRAAILLSILLVGVGLSSILGEVRWELVAEQPWLRVPELFPFGRPGAGWELRWVVVAGVAAGYMGSIVESIGDYTATCAVTRRELSARDINRGIFAEGLGCVVASVVGGLPCTSYTQNIGIIAATQVGSRRVVQVAAGILLLYGLCPKLGSLLVAIPRSVLGGVFILICGLIVMAGLRLIGQAISRDEGFQWVAGPSLLVAVTLPNYAQSELGADYLASLPVLVSLVLSNTVVLTMLMGVGLNSAREILRNRF